MKETAHTINKQLVGVYTHAIKRNDHAKELPTILFFNSGLLPHIGPYRLYVKLARFFAKQGFNSFRFDLSGIGDSEKHKDSRLHKLQHNEDIDKVLDFLNLEHGDASFISLGICSGAENAHETMARDKRVVGAVSIDGYIYPTTKYYINRYLPKMFSFTSWKTLAKISFAKLVSIVRQNKETEMNSIDMSSNKPSKEKISREYQDFINRDASLLSVFTASWPCNYKEQLSDVFSDLPFGDNLQTTYLEDAEHIFPLAEDRQALTKIISNWLEERFVSA